MKEKTTYRTKTVKIDMYVREEIKKYGLIKDIYGNIFKLPYVDSSSRKHKLKQLKPFFHTGYEVLNINQKFIDTKKIKQESVKVRYKMRFEMLKKNVPHQYNTLIEN